jgi:hypothetical protein
MRCALGAAGDGAVVVWAWLGGAAVKSMLAASAAALTLSNLRAGRENNVCMTIVPLHLSFTSKLASHEACAHISKRKQIVPTAAHKRFALKLPYAN